MSFTPQYFSLSVIPASNLRAPGVTIPAAPQWPYFRSAPMNPATTRRGQRCAQDCSISCFRKRSPHRSQTQIWHRGVYWPTSVSALSLTNPTPRTTRRRTHIPITICSSVTLSWKGLSVPWEQLETQTKKLVPTTYRPCASKQNLSLPIYTGNFKPATSAFAITLAVTEEPALCFQPHLFYVACQETAVKTFHCSSLKKTLFLLSYKGRKALRTW